MKTTLYVDTWGIIINLMRIRVLLDIVSFRENPQFLKIHNLLIFLNWILELSGEFL